MQALVLGMATRDDREHDIAAWFGVNQGTNRGDQSRPGPQAVVSPTATRMTPRLEPGLKLMTRPEPARFCRRPELPERTVLGWEAQPCEIVR